MDCGTGSQVPTSCPVNSNLLSLEVSAQVQRVHLSSPSDAPAIEHAADALPGLVKLLGLRSFTGALRADSKPRLLLRFQHADSVSMQGGVVLKLYGDRPRGEGPLLESWRRSGVPTPLLVHGETEFCSWLLMEELRLTPLRLRDAAVRDRITDQLARLAATMHQPASDVEGRLRSLDEVIFPRWQAARTALVESGASIPDHWSALALEAYRKGRRVPLHGDLAEQNMGAVDDSLILFDASALLGHKAFDAARWSARLARYGANPTRTFDQWSQLEELHPLAEAHLLLAAECVLEAGSLVAARPIANGPLTSGVLHALLDSASVLFSEAAHG